jgi:hypothetical protein
LRLISDARQAQEPGESFTETLLTLAARTVHVDGALRLATFHQPLSAATDVVRLAAHEATSSRVRGLCDNVGEREIMVLTSAVETTSGVLHLPMLDFKLNCSPEHDLVAQTVAESLGRGWLLNSGSSYHYYGATLLSERELFDWLLRAQLMGKFVDSRWVTHQLLERKCALRVSHKGGAAVPQVIWQSL